MLTESRVQKSLLNARVNLIFYFIILFFAFFSRRIFINSLGVEFVGLTTTLQNLLGFLNLAELGVGTAIAYVLYKPLADQNQTKINEIVSVLAYMYRRIGMVILYGGMLLAVFLPLIFKKADCSFGVIYFGYFSYLISSLISYFANFKQILLSADQKNYVATTYLQTLTTVKLLIQMALAKYTANPYVWIGIELIFGISYSFILNARVKKAYPWVSADVLSGKQKLKDYPEVIRNVKRLFIHKVTSFTQTQVSPFLVYAFVSLKLVTFYGNYITIVQKLSILVYSVLGSTEASIGNLIAHEGDRHRVKEIFRELLAIRFFIAGSFVFLIYNLIEPFITIWLGQEYVMSQTVLFLILLDVFISQYRGAVDQFLYGYGLFGDIWASITEITVFFIIALVFGYHWKLNGILMASVISKYLNAGLWKPYYLFTRGFKESIWSYWKLWLRNVFAILLTYGSLVLLMREVALTVPTRIVGWGLYALALCAAYVVIALVFMYLLVPGTKSLLMRFIQIRLHRPSDSSRPTTQNPSHDQQQDNPSSHRPPS